jgi:hypothetical protein
MVVYTIRLRETAGSEKNAFPLPVVSGPFAVHVQSRLDTNEMEDDHRRANGIGGG